MSFVKKLKNPTLINIFNFMNNFTVEYLYSEDLYSAKHICFSKLWFCRIDEKFCRGEVKTVSFHCNV